MTRRSGLGRGLDALIPGDDQSLSGVIQIPVAEIIPNPRQPRSQFGDEDLEELATSIKQFGLIQPVIVSEDKDFVAGVHPVNGKPLTFTMPDLIYPEKYRNLELVPFSGIHEARYMIYWLVMTADSLESRNKALREKEDQLLAIESMTVDQVAPGEQQPEAEHNFKGENTESGVFQGKHWRHAKGWFSYDLNNTGREGCILRVTYYGLDRGRNFDILVNDQVIATVKLDGSHGNAFFEKEYTIPQDILDGNQNDVLNVKFKAHKGSVAGGIYYLRLIK